MALLVLGAVLALPHVGLWVGDAVVLALLLASSGLAQIIRQAGAWDWATGDAPRGDGVADAHGTRRPRWALSGDGIGVVLIVSAAPVFLHDPSGSTGRVRVDPGAEAPSRWPGRDQRRVGAGDSAAGVFGDLVVTGRSRVARRRSAVRGGGGFVAAGWGRGEPRTWTHEQRRRRRIVCDVNA